MYTQNNLKKNVYSLLDNAPNYLASWVRYPKEKYVYPMAKTPFAFAPQYSI